MHAHLARAPFDSRSRVLCWGASHFGAWLCLPAPYALCLGACLRHMRSVCMLAVPACLPVTPSYFVRVLTRAISAIFTANKPIECEYVVSFVIVDNHNVLTNSMVPPCVLCGITNLLSIQRRMKQTLNRFGQTKEMILSHKTLHTSTPGTLVESLSTPQPLPLTVRCGGFHPLWWRQASGRFLCLRCKRTYTN